MLWGFKGCQGKQQQASRGIGIAKRATDVHQRAHQGKSDTPPVESVGRSSQALSKSLIDLSPQFNLINTRRTAGRRTEEGGSGDRSIQTGCAERTRFQSNRSEASPQPAASIMAAAAARTNEAVEGEIELLLASLGVDPSEAEAGAAGEGEGGDDTLLPVRIARRRATVGACVCVVSVRLGLGFGFGGVYIDVSTAPTKSPLTFHSNPSIHHCNRTKVTAATAAWWKSPSGAGRARSRASWRRAW